MSLKDTFDSEYDSIFTESNFRVPRLIFLFGIISVILVAVYANHSVNEKDRYRFTILTKEILDTVNDRLSTYTSGLRGATGIYNGNGTINFEVLQGYTHALRLDQHFPGSQGIGYAPRTPSANLKELNSRIRAEYYPYFNLEPMSGRSEYYPVTYIAPMIPQNELLIGNDLFLDPVNQKAMIHAAQTGNAALTGKKELLQPSKGSQPGFLLFMPIYTPVSRTDSDLSSLGKQPAAKELRGFVFSPFIAKDFFKGIFRKSIDKYVNIHVYGGSINEKERFYDTHENLELPSCDKCDLRVETIELLGSKWHFVFKALPSFYANSTKTTVFFLCLGQLILVLIISLLAYLQSKAKARVVEANNEIENLLARERSAREHAERASQLKEEFLATVSHELRSPLNAILGWAQIINRPNAKSDNVKKGLETIEKNVHIQAKLIDDLLEMSRITSGKLKLDIRQTEIAKVLDNALEAVSPAIKAKGISIEKHVDAGLPFVPADSGRIQQVFWNLLSNAIKFSKNGDTIQIKLWHEADHVRFSVKDSGIGISKEFLPYIFDRFRQENSKENKRHGGLGLGLAISKNLIELHGGEIGVHSTGYGMGSEFFFSLPVDHPGLRKAREHEALSPPSYDGDALSRLSLLVIDDEEDARDMLAQAMTLHGAEVDCASSVNEGLRKLNGKNYNVVISDIGMPVRDGYDLAREIRSHPKQSIRKKPIIALSAFARENDRQRSKAAGFSAHLAKPLRIDELIEVIGDLSKEGMKHEQNRPDRG